MEFDPRLVRPTYTDRLREVVQFSSDSDNEPARVSTTFPGLLYFILQTSDRDEISHIVSWQPHGRSFVIRDKDTFVSQVMSKYFNSARFSSFQKQLNIYGFTKIARGTDRGGWYNEYFLRGRPDLLTKVKRVVVKGRGARKLPARDAVPDFYSMPYCIDVASSSGGSDTTTNNGNGKGNGTSESGSGNSSETSRASSPCSSDDGKKMKEGYSSGPGHTENTTTAASDSGGETDPTGTATSTPSGESDRSVKSANHLGARRRYVRSARSQFPVSSGSDASASGGSTMPPKKSRKRRRPSDTCMVVNSSDDRRNRSSSDEKPEASSSSDDKSSEANSSSDELPQDTSSSEKASGSSDDTNGSSSDEKQKRRRSNGSRKYNGNCSSSDEIPNESSSDGKNSGSSDEDQSTCMSEGSLLKTGIQNGTDASRLSSFDFGDAEVDYSTIFDDDQDHLVPTTYARQNAVEMYTTLSSQGYFFVGACADSPCSNSLVQKGKM